MLNEHEKGKSSRRRFLSLGLLTGAGLIVHNVEAQVDIAPDDPESKRTKMLTPDGQLVEIDENVLAQAMQGNKATNRDILDWTTAHQNTKE